MLLRIIYINVHYFLAKKKFKRQKSRSEQTSEFLSFQHFQVWFVVDG